MTRKEAVVLASRALALYLICWGLSEVVSLPQILLDIHHHWRHTSVLTEISPDYLLTYHEVQLAAYLVRTAALFVTARWLMKHTDSVFRYFLALQPGEVQTNSN